MCVYLSLFFLAGAMANYAGGYVLPLLALFRRARGGMVSGRPTNKDYRAENDSIIDRPIECLGAIGMDNSIHEDVGAMIPR